METPGDWGLDIGRGEVPIACVHWEEKQYTKGHLLYPPPQPRVACEPLSLSETQ